MVPVSLNTRKVASRPTAVLVRTPGVFQLVVVEDGQFVNPKPFVLIIKVLFIEYQVHRAALVSGIERLIFANSRFHQGTGGQETGMQSGGEVLLPRFTQCDVR